MAMLIDPKKLDFWVGHGYNVLFEGAHGVGKTSIVHSCFQRNGLRYASLSGATMDPFIDFVGVPVTVTTAEGEKVIDLLRPKYLIDLNPQAIFIDEFNRSHKKIRNAVMELIQFKTINGQKVGNDLRVVWAAINPDSEDGEGVYDTDRLDPAQRDRFQIQVVIPFKCDKDFFADKYGVDNAKAAITWWDDLPNNVRTGISPRRLDYALSVWQDGGDMRDVLPPSTNCGRLVNMLQVGPVEKRLNPLMNNPEGARAFLKVENNYNEAINVILREKRYSDAFLQYVPQEKMATLFTSNIQARKLITQNLEQKGPNSPFIKPLEQIMLAGVNSENAKAITALMERYVKSAKAATPASPANAFGNQPTQLADLNAVAMNIPDTTLGRKASYESLVRCLGSIDTREVADKVMDIAEKLCNARFGTIERDMPRMLEITDAVVAALKATGMSQADARDYVDAHPNAFRFRAKSGRPKLKETLR